MNTLHERLEAAREANRRMAEEQEAEEARTRRAYMNASAEKAREAAREALGINLDPAAIEFDEERWPGLRFSVEGLTFRLGGNGLEWMKPCPKCQAPTFNIEFQTLRQLARAMDQDWSSEYICDDCERERFQAGMQDPCEAMPEPRREPTPAEALLAALDLYLSERGASE